MPPLDNKHKAVRLASRTPTKKQNIEMVNRHIVDNKDSFLDENVWDILNDV